MRKKKDEAFAKLIMENKEHLYKCAYYYLGNSEDALEAVQETAYRAYKNRKSIRENGKGVFKAWVTKILVNYCKDVYKQRSKVIPIEDFRKIQHLENTWYTEEVTENYYTFEVLSHMEDPYREVLILRFVRDLKIKDISEILDKPESTIKSQIKKGVSLFKKEYVGDEKYYEKYYEK